ncbi:hypothetical protein [Nocardia terpenica]|uniref:Uncharacterized protein n=1 Tax=Nocardia terpenica TaxID=455432 RepID=A0A164HVA2_9NOCA|nr:hypothetical protein [Nocardia terpenica]KZM68850.1 hypothetical protein AWN90_13760 [Nocardia terpenica]NQE88106.1 hypothetical protein [Nocardia terpenica]
MKTIILEWIDISDHSLKVTVPEDFDPDDIDSEYEDLYDDLAEFDSESYNGCTREGAYIRKVVKYDPQASTLYLD